MSISASHARSRARRVAGPLLFGRPLLPQERLYFRDGNPANVSRENLLIVPVRAGQPFVCACCGAARVCYRAHVPRGGRCRACRKAASDRGLERVRAVLQDPALADWSDRQIARWVGVHFSVVGPLRRQTAGARRDRRKYMVGESERVQAVGSRGRMRRVRLYSPEKEVESGS
jgi:hypothetical protein